MLDLLVMTNHHQKPLTLETLSAIQQLYLLACRSEYQLLMLG